MREGINLASRPIRHRTLLRCVGSLLLLAVLVTSGVHWVFWRDGSRAEGDLEEQIARLERRREALETELHNLRRELAAGSAVRTLKQLVAVERSGAARAVAPVEILTELASLMPPRAEAVSLRLEASPPEPELEMEVRARSAEAATELISAVSRSPFVSRTEILEERHGGDGAIMLRLKAELTGDRRSR